MTLDPNKMKRYEREGYPKFIRGHEHKGKSYVKGISKSQETKDKIRKKCKENAQKEDYVHPMKGKHHTLESIKANRLAHLGNKNAEGHIVSEEQKQKQREKMLGRPSPMKGRIRSLESNLKQSIAMKSKSPWNDGLVGVQESPMKGKHHTSESIEKIKENTTIYSGEDHWNWQGGITPLYKQIRFCNRYDEWRNLVFRRDSFTCQHCKILGVRFEAHHIKLFSTLLKENNITTLEQAILCESLWDLNNGLTLCEECHNKTKGKSYEE